MKSIAMFYCDSPPQYVTKHHEKGGFVAGYCKRPIDYSLEFRLYAACRRSRTEIYPGLPGRQRADDESSKVEHSARRAPTN